MARVATRALLLFLIISSLFVLSSHIPQVNSFAAELLFGFLVTAGVSALFHPNNVATCVLGDV